MRNRPICVLHLVLCVSIAFPACKNDCEKAIAHFESCYDDFCDHGPGGAACTDGVRNELRAQMTGELSQCDESTAEAAKELSATSCDDMRVIFAIAGAFEGADSDNDGNMRIRVGEPTAETVDVGGRQLSAVECTLDGPAMIEEVYFVGQTLQVAPDGTLYLIDHNGAVRAYAVGSGSGCNLQLKTDFGDAGILTIENGANSLSVDQSSNLVIGSEGFAYRVANGQIASSCELPGNVNWDFAVAPDGTWGRTVSSTLRVDFNDTGCVVGTGDDLSDFMDDVQTVSITDGRIWIGMKKHRDGESSPYEVVAFDHENTELLRFGNERGLAPDGFGYIHAIEPCGDNICVVDRAFSKLKVWSPSGDFVGQADLGDLLGVRGIVANGFDAGPDGAGYILVWEQLDEKHGRLFRIDGL